MTSIKRKLPKPNDVSKNLFELKVNGTLCDVQLHLQGTTTTAHACVLASCSPFFLKLFELNQGVHWCPRNPLVINLEEFLENYEDLCVICVSKIIDFMYLRELVILQDHYEHFVAINGLFNVFDSYPLSENCKKTKLNKPSTVESSPTEELIEKSKIVRNKNSTENLFLKQTHYVSVASKTIKTCKENEYGINKSKSNVTDSITVDPKLGNTNQLIKESKCASEHSVTPSDSVVKKTNSKNICEFMCCNPEPETNSDLAKLRKRRKMFCELCDFTSVSITKVVQHLHCTEHLQSTCPVCLGKFLNINDLKDHLKDHVNSKPFICQICSKRNRYWDYHKMHMKIHCRNKSFYCDLCRRGFRSKRSLTEHLSTHKGSYLCKNCDYYTSDLSMYKSHLNEHDKQVSKNDLSSHFRFDSDSQLTKSSVKKFHCQVCGEGFTQKKNLDRHVKLKHFDVTKLKCSMCLFVSDRIDLLSKHMKKKHGCTLVKEKKCLIGTSRNNNAENRSDIVSVLIPLQLVSDNPSVNSFAAENSERALGDTINSQAISSQENSFSKTHDIIHQNSNVELEIVVESDVTVNTSMEQTQVNVSSDNQQDNHRSIMESNGLVKDHPDNSFNVNMEIPENTPQTFSGTEIVNLTESNTPEKEEVVVEGNQYIWLNETTGELLNDTTFINLQDQKTVHSANQNVPGTENLSSDFCDQLKSSFVNEALGECSTLDFMDENEDWQIPRTPQTNVVGIDESDNLFPWTQIDNSFYSTWVLNETTGELNMVSFFSIQSVRNPTELKVDEKSKSPLPLEDDDTALFLNEGTGDLSVIYFKPNGMEGDGLNFQPSEMPCNDNLETRSDISDDDSDLLNEEFMRVSANFMSNEENEKFLNELTGEFDNANLDSYQPEVLSNQISANESYLNEETGEISWNVMDDNVNNDLFKKPDGLEYDLDDSLNCEDFESFFRDVSEFSSQFCLDKASTNWQPADEASETLVLNECTGELVKKN